MIKIRPVPLLFIVVLTATLVFLMSLSITNKSYDTIPTLYGVTVETTSNEFDENLKLVASSLQNMDGGCWDSHTLTPALSAIYRNFRLKTTNFRFVFVDVGAHIGQTTAGFLSAFSDISCHQTRADVNFYCKCRESSELFVAFEPFPANYDKLMKSHDRLNWTLAPVIAINAAAANFNGNATFYWNFGNEKQGSLDAEAAYSDTNISVPTVKLDTTFGINIESKGVRINDAQIRLLQTQLNNQSWEIFLLKIDAEGYDFDVILGANELLKRHLVKFLTFEYNSKWFSKGRNFTLEKAIAHLYQLDYFCYFITERKLIPISDVHWHQSYEIRQWSNVVCGRISDKDLNTLVALMVCS